MANLITESMLLPSSQAKLYGDGFDGRITLRAMTTEEERMRLSAQSFYPTMSLIINECIVDNKNPDGSYKLDSKNFTDFDFFAVCVKLRIISYGNKYETFCKCTKCGYEQKYIGDLSQVDYTLVPEDFVEPYEIGPLPSSGDTLGCRFLRVKDHIDIEKQKDLILSKNLNYVGDPTFNLEMERRIVTVNGKELDFVLAQEYVKNMIAMDNFYYQKKVNSFPFGVNRVSFIDCPSGTGCDGVTYWIVRADREFFRPYFDD